VLQWWPVVGEDIPTPNTIEIVVFTFFFHQGFGLSACDFLRWLLQHYQIKLVNSILQIAIFVHLYEAFLGIPPNFPLLKNYFFLKYQAPITERLSEALDSRLVLLVTSSTFQWNLLSRDVLGLGFIKKTVNPASPLL
jgi:hypothetical protein